VLGDPQCCLQPHNASSRCQVGECMWRGTTSLLVEDRRTEGGGMRDGEVREEADKTRASWQWRVRGRNNTGAIEGLDSCKEFLLVCFTVRVCIRTLHPRHSTPPFLSSP
jgi:hypothetical protein